MLVEATVLGTASAAGAGLTWSRLPEQAKQFCIEHPLLTDVVATALTYEILGGTLIALLAAGFVSVVISVILYLATYKQKREAAKA